MSQPIWLDVATADDLLPPEVIAARARRGTHVVLRFPLTLDVAGKAGVIARLSAALPDHSVFDSGGGRTSTNVTVMPVVPRREVIERRADVLRAIEDYRDTCASLVERYRRGSLPSSEWKTCEHGRECRFENRRTGRVVEAPFKERVDDSRVDPYFFAIFLRTTPGHERVLGLIREDYHDAARILDVVEGGEGAWRGDV